MKLSEEKIKAGWQIVRFDEIARNISERVEPAETDLDVYVGLEHLDPQSLRITRRGVPSDVEGQKLRVRPGQIIFGKRRAYQKKLAVADFDGICSAHAMVLEEIPGKIIPGLLPYFMQSDMFMDRAVAISEGSLSPTIKWKALAMQEFPLPPPARQKAILEVLEKVEENLQKTKAAQNDLLRLKIRMLTELFRESGVKSVRLGAVFTVQLGKMLSPKAKTGHYMRQYLRNIDIQWHSINLADLPLMNFVENERLKFRLFDGDILMCEGGEIGRCAIWHNVSGEYYFQKALHRLRPKDSDQIIPEYALYYFEYKFRYSTDFLSERGITTIAHLPRIKLLNLPISLHSMSEQRKIVNQFMESDRLNGVLESRRASLQRIYSGMMNQWLEAGGSPII